MTQGCPDSSPPLLTACRRHGDRVRCGPVPLIDAPVGAAMAGVRDPPCELVASDGQISGHKPGALATGFGLILRTPHVAAGREHQGVWNPEALSHAEVMFPHEEPVSTLCIDISLLAKESGLCFSVT